jgi:hypothetical protein
LCSLPIDAAPLEKTLGQAIVNAGLAGLERELASMQRMVARTGASSLEPTLAPSIERALCAAFDERALDKQIKSLEDYARFFGGGDRDGLSGVRVFEFSPKPELTCPKGRLSAAIAREKLARRYRALLHKTRGTPAELAELVRTTFALERPHLARVDRAGEASARLELPPAFDLSEEQIASFERACTPKPCEELERLIDSLGPGSPEITAHACRAVPEGPRVPGTIEVGAPGQVTSTSVDCYANNELEVQLELKPDAGRALLVRSERPFKIARIEVGEKHKRRDLKLGWVYMVVLDLEDRLMFGSKKRVAIEASAESQRFYWSTTRTPEL